MRRTFSAVLILSCVLAGCRAKEAKISQDLEKHGTMDLMKDVSKDKYTPPSDGKLTDAQMQMYLKVRGHEKDIAQVARKEAQAHADAAKKAGDKSIAGMIEGFKTMGSAAAMLTADIRAAKDLGYNTQEYLWVKVQIMGASTAAFAEQMTKAMSTQMEASRAQMQKAYDEAKDEQTKQMYKQMLDNYEKTVKEGQQTTAQISPDVQYNRQLLKKYDSELAAFTNELGKYENKEGEAKASVDELQKKLDETAKDKQSQ